MRRLTGRIIPLLAGLAVMCGAGPSSAAAEPSPLGEWRFDEPDGQAAWDHGPHGLDGRLGSTPELDAADPVRIPGVSGGALRFDGGSFVRLPEARELAAQTLTIEAVVRASSSPGPFRYLVSRGSHHCIAVAYGLYTGRAGGIAIYVSDGSRYAVSAVARPADVWDGAWHHVAGTFDGRALRVYVDGRPVGEALDTPMHIDYAGTTMSAAFGRYVGDCDLSHQGDLDLVRLWSGAASAGSLAAAAERALRPGSDPPPGAPLPPLPAALPPEILPAAPSAGGPRPAWRGRVRRPAHGRAGSAASGLQRCAVAQAHRRRAPDDGARTGDAARSPGAGRARGRQAARQADHGGAHQRERPREPDDAHPPAGTRADHRGDASQLRARLRPRGALGASREVLTRAGR